MKPEQPNRPEIKGQPTGHALHVEAEGQREGGRRPDDFRHAATTAYNAAILSLQEGNLSEAAQSHASQMLALRHLADTAGEDSPMVRKSILQEATLTGELAVEMARGVGEQAVRIPLYTLGKVYEDTGDLEKAGKAYAEAIDIFERYTEPTGNIPVELELADMQAHLAVVEYKLGKRQTLEDVDEAIETMTSFPPNQTYDYERYVWLSGAHMGYAQTVASTNPEEARTHLDDAQAVIQANTQSYPNLALRQQQLERLRNALHI